MMEDRRWKTVHNAPNYEVSEDEYVRNKKTGRVLKTYGKEKTRVTLMSFGERLTVYVTDLVAEEFRRRITAVTNEKWRVVDCALGYEVSDQGAVRNFRTKRILKPYLNPRTGLEQVTLSDAGYRITRSIRQLMKEAFEG